MESEYSLTTVKLIGFQSIVKGKVKDKHPLEG
jgi:hypothetical protein